MGKLLHLCQVSCMCEMLTGKSEELFVKDEIAFLLHLLPPGTKLVSNGRQTDQRTLSVNYEIVFEHPMFLDGTVMECEYMRTVWPVGEGDWRHIEHGNLFLGFKVHYYQPNGSELGIYTQNPQL